MAVATLLHPEGLAAWHAWQMRRRGWRARIKRALDTRVSAPQTPWRVYSTSADTPDVLVALDAATPTAVKALLRPLRYLTGRSVAVVAPPSAERALPPGDWQQSATSPRDVALLAQGAAATLALGHYLPIGAAAQRGARVGTFVTIQHGLLTPHVPPLAPDTRLLAWSAADADFWRSGRSDIATTVVGSQLLYEAAQQPATNPPSADARPVYLGQLHGAELDRAALARSTEAFCRRTGASYRPHPSETDRRSRATHRRWGRAGIDIDRRALPLMDLNAPVVSAFSTGILEAAARGMPAWAFHLDPPSWLTEFWNRYGMHRWGKSPTPAAPLPAIEPAQAIAQIVTTMIGGAS